MQDPTDSEKTLKVIERLKLAQLGEYKKWQNLIKKINDGINLDEEEYQYIATLSRTYKEGQKYTRSKIYHTKLSDLDERPLCKKCGEDSLFYCNMNDEYFCAVHIVGHDENEL